MGSEAAGRPTAQSSWRLARWKILDNLRRSLEPAAFLAMLLWGWFGIDQATLWTLAVLGLVLTQPLLGTLLELLRKPHEISLGQHLRATSGMAALHFGRALLTLVWLPFEALLSLDAIARTLWRMLVSRHHLLQWSPSREVERSSRNDVLDLYRLMWIAPTLALACAAILLPHPVALALASPLLLLWLFSPVIAWWLSRPKAQTNFEPSAEELRFLHNLARKTWAFFDQHVGPLDNWLPPDNVQEQPSQVIAHRTSPTNMGMALLSHLAAYDFGYLSSGRLLARLDHSLSSMASLERHRRHFFNWYDTQTLKPLPPHYVSTVDSGDLAGLLLTLRPGLLELADQPLLSPQLFAGLADTFSLLRESVINAHLDEYVLREVQGELDTAQAAPRSLEATCQHLQRLLDHSQRLYKTLQPVQNSESERWLQALVAHCEDLHGELSQFWLPPLGAGEQPAQATWHQLAQLDSTQWPVSDQVQVQAVQRRANERITCAARLAQQSSDLAKMDFGFSTNRSAICSPSATTPTRTVGTPPSTTYWPPRRG